MEFYPDGNTFLQCIDCQQLVNLQKSGPSISLVHCECLPTETTVEKTYPVINVDGEEGLNGSNVFIVPLSLKSMQYRHWLPVVLVKVVSAAHWLYITMSTLFDMWPRDIPCAGSCRTLHRRISLDKFQNWPVCEEGSKTPKTHGSGANKYFVNKKKLSAGFIDQRIAVSSPTWYLPTSWPLVTGNCLPLTSAYSATLWWQRILRVTEHKRQGAAIQKITLL